MAENNLVEMTSIRKRQVIGEIIHNTELCCLVWNETGQPGQYTATTRANQLLLGDKKYTFYISRINSGIYLDVLVNCKRFVTYNSSSFPDVAVLYQIIEGISNRRTDNIGEAIQNLQNVPPQCGILFTEYTRGGIVVGGRAIKTYVNKKTDGGVIVGGHAPYEQTEFPEGGSVIGGEAQINPTIEYPEGGIVVGGEVLENILTTVSGGVVTGGSVVFELTMPTSGGMVVGESAEIDFVYNLDTTGGVVTKLSFAERVLWMNEVNWPTDANLSYSDLEITQIDLYRDIPIDFSQYGQSRFALDPVNDRIFWQGLTNPNVYVATQTDSSSAIKIFDGPTFTSGAGLDYDPSAELLAFSHRTVSDANPTQYIMQTDGTIVDSFTNNGDGIFSGDIVRANCLDCANDFIFVLVTIQGGSSRIEKWSLTTLTRLTNSSPISGSDIMEIDRDQQLLFVATSGSPSVVTSYDYDYNLISIVIPYPVAENVYSIALDTKNQKLYASVLEGTTRKILRMDYDGSNRETIRNNLGTVNNMEIQNNNFETAIVQHIPA